MSQPNTLQKYSINAAQSFIQTAVFVDDRIFEGVSSGSGEPRLVSAPKKRKKAIKSVEGDEGKVPSGIDEDIEEPAPDTYDIVNSFAKKQIVCSLYQPKSTAKVSPASDIFPLCRAADVVIVDWDLFGDKGQRAKDLIDGLITQAVRDVPEQLRLILVYTQEINLFGVANEIYEKVHESIGDGFRPVEGENGLAFHTDNSRVVVFGKPGRARPDTEGRHVVEETLLAEVAICEFAKLASGILHAATLLGLAEIRNNSRKILSKFNKDLDPAFLTHLAMCLPQEDASSHVIPLLVSEIEAVLEDVLPDPLIPDRVLEDWCLNVWEPAQHLSQVFGQGNLDYRKIAKSICIKGFEKACEDHGQIPKINTQKKKTEKIRSAAKIFLPYSESDVNHKFSQLMASRTFYGSGSKTLKLGSIIYEEEKDSYFLCVQPVCDSVRLKAPRTFVFVEMEKAQPGTGSASHVVVLPDGSLLELLYQPKSYLCYAVSFTPDSSAQQIVANVDDDGVSYFEDVDGTKYHWVDQLKASHAQRAVEQFASDLSRVGLTESEWLRRLSSK